MKLIGNIIWFIFGGFIISLIWFLLGVIFCVIIIGIPLGLQCFKFAKLTLWPFGKKVDSDFMKHPILNIIWIIIAGWAMFINSIILGTLFCLTVFGIPFGLQWFKIAILSLMPFGTEIK